MRYPYDEAKLTEMVLYVAARLQGDRSGGATKLNKVLYFADFAHVRRHGRPISGAEYQKLPQGPAPRRLKPVRQRLVDEGAAAVETEDFLGYRLHRLVPRRQADLTLFDEDERATLDKVLDDLAGSPPPRSRSSRTRRRAGACATRARPSRTRAPTPATRR